MNILEFGCGAAGPVSTRYFEHGVTVLPIESASRPDLLRVMALGPKNPHGLEASPLYDALNVGKRNATFRSRSCGGSWWSGPTISACLNFGSQGSALSGFTYLTGWPDREPVGPFGTITDSLALRYVAAAVAAGLHTAAAPGVASTWTCRRWRWASSRCRRGSSGRMPAARSWA